MTALLQLLGLLMALAAITTAVVLYIRQYRGKWKLVNVKGDFTGEHHLPDEIPVPATEASRVSGGEYGFDEVVGWMREFLKKRKRHRLRGEFELVLRKYELYRELSEKMGRGLWTDVDALGARLAEVDPLDPSAAIARGRAMREMGNYPVAIRFYQKALELTPFHSAAFPEMAATCRVIGQPGRFQTALEKARQELGETHPLTLEGRVQLGELVRVYADPTDAATVAHIPREQYLFNVQARLDEMTLDPETAIQVGQTMLADDMPELADNVVARCEREFGECAESLLLQGMIEHYRLNNEAAEQHIRSSLDREDCGIVRLELGKVLLERAMREEDAAARLELRDQARQELRLAVDRDPDLVEAIALLVEKGWENGLAGVVKELEPLLAVYSHTWGVWKVLGDAYTAESKYDKAIECYQKGLANEKADVLVTACLSTLEQADRRPEMLKLVRGLENLADRDPQLRWKAAQVLCEHQKLQRARLVLQALVDDEQVAPYLRQRANDVLDHLDDIERQQFKRERIAKRLKKA